MIARARRWDAFRGGSSRNCQPPMDQAMNSANRPPLGDSARTGNSLLPLREKVASEARRLRGPRRSRVRFMNPIPTLSPPQGVRKNARLSTGYWARVGLGARRPHDRLATLLRAKGCLAAMVARNPGHNPLKRWNPRPESRPSRGLDLRGALWEATRISASGAGDRRSEIWVARMLGRKPLKRLIPRPSISNRRAGSGANPAKSRMATGAHASPLPALTRIC